jgi:hypothetical protein
VSATLMRLPATDEDPSELLGLRLRELGNILRYSHPDYTGMKVLYGRSYEKKSPGVQRWARRLMRLGRGPGRVANWSAARFEKLVPPSASARAFIAEQAPDAIAAAPVNRNPMLVDYFKAGAYEGISTSAWIQSWDNLTNKGLLHFAPTRVFVWNKYQEAELARYHGIPSENVCMTGAQTFDHWFADVPVWSRSDFCARMGLDPERPIILYLASSKQIAPNEAELFVPWLKAVRSSSDPAVREASVLVRPHPTVLQPWLDLGVDKEPHVGLSPATHRDRLNSDEFREQYRNELHHASIGVGINTSGLIDAAIFGKPVCTVELPETFYGQRGTVHFQHLVREGSELLLTSSSLDEHAEVLSGLIRRDPYERDERSVAFVEDFIRPHGPDVSPSAVFAQEMSKLCRQPAPAKPPGRFRRAVEGLTGRLAVVLGAPLETRPFQSLAAYFSASMIVRYVRIRHRLTRKRRSALDQAAAAGITPPQKQKRPRERAAKPGARPIRRPHVFRAGGVQNGTPATLDGATIRPMRMRRGSESDVSGGDASMTAIERLEQQVEDLAARVEWLHTRIDTVIGDEPRGGRGEGSRPESRRKPRFGRQKEVRAQEKQELRDKKAGRAVARPRHLPELEPDATEQSPR